MTLFKVLCVYLRSQSPFFALAGPHICSHFPEEEMTFSEEQRDQAERSSPSFSLMKTNIFPSEIT